MYQLRAARMDELTKLTELCVQSKAFWGYDDAFIRDCRDKLNFHPADMEKSHICVAENDHTLLGVAQLLFTDEIAFLERLCVAPANLKTGIGKSLFGWSINTAHRAGAKRLLIECDHHSAGFYQRMGAREEEFVESRVFPGQQLPRFNITLTPSRRSAGA
ncbi:GNAT family N-acetyltransferase [Acerihabitans sp. TG2]|uniref:GNAT family N-acetyltransferase n=1 Tax=Acerihabitans sp. TG2 TaxID=3096008 RepID=UPI002B2271FA|nr:GNAT family N-acetyltransferase [Acerihabitans sp. TG2]MEA9390566.1 GNAT family N-acetyltransferase [Acerihabitans sp. TG2]